MLWHVRCIYPHRVIANKSIGLLLLPELLVLTAVRLWLPIPESIASRRAKEDENCDSICSNLVSSPATLDAVSDILEMEVSSAF